MRRHPDQLAKLREKAVAMRRGGRTYNEIKDVLGVSKGSLSPWLWDLDDPTPEQRAALGRSPEETRAMGRAYWDRKLAEREVDRQAVKTEAAAAVGHLSDRELDLIAVTAYWCEGAKDKPYAGLEVVVLKRHNPKTIRKNTSEAYVGCLVVRVLQSRVLYQEIEGMWRGISTGTAASTTSA